MTFFVPRRSAAGKSAQKGGSSVTSTATTTTTSTPAGNTTFRTVTKQVAPVTAQTTTSLSERQALAKQKLKKQRQQQAADEEVEYQRDSLKRKKQQQLDKLKQQKQQQDKGKAKQIDQDSSDDDGIPQRVTKQQKTSYTLVSVDQDSDDLGTPVHERPNPLRVVRTNLAAPQDSLSGIPIIHGGDLVKRTLATYVQYFPDLPKDSIVSLEYPGINAQERFLLLSPRAKDQQDYQPIQDIISTIRVICDWFLTPEQAMNHFKHVPHQSSSALGDFDFLNETPRASTSHPTTRDSTPQSEVGTPEPQAATSANFTKFPLLRQLEKAFRRKNGKEFVSVVGYYNSVMSSLKAGGSIQANIQALGLSQGVPEAVWQRISGQCYERTVSPRVEELKKYEAFSDNTYGELLPPFVAHIASLTGLGENSVLVDMGSGVGNCCVQASLATGCKSYGFENQTAASEIAAAQVKEAKARARLWGLQTGDCETHDLDFLQTPQIVGPALAKADVVLVNNYVFSPKTNDNLSLLFLDLKDGAKVVSLRPFVNSSGETAITPRNIGSPANILNQSKPIKYDRGSVSWSDTGGTFFVAEVNRDRLKRYYEKMG